MRGLGSGCNLQPISSHLGRAVGNRNHSSCGETRVLGTAKCDHQSWSRPVSQGTLPSPVYSSPKPVPVRISVELHKACALADEAFRPAEMSGDFLGNRTVPSASLNLSCYCLLMWLQTRGHSAPGRLPAQPASKQPRSKQHLVTLRNLPQKCREAAEDIQPPNVNSSALEVFSVLLIIIMRNDCLSRKS